MIPILPVLGFLGRHWKLLGIVVLGVFLYFQLKGFIRDVADAWQERQNRIVTLTTERDRAVIEAESAKAVELHLREQQAMLKSLLAEAKAEQQRIRDDARQERGVLEDRDRLNRLLNARPGRLEALANAATQERFDDLEALFNQ